MFVSRYLGRTLFAAAKSETSAAAAAATSSARTGYNPLEEFFEVDRSPDEDKPVVYGTFISVIFLLFIVYLNWGKLNFIHHYVRGVFCMLSGQ